MTSHVRATLAFLGATAMLTGCGGEPATVPDHDAVLRLKLDEYSIRPQNLRVVATTSPTRIRIIAQNVGRLTHTVKIKRILTDEEPHDPPAIEPSPIVGGIEGNLFPGQTARSADIFLPPGTYRLADTVGNHENLGQYGTLTIVPPPIS